MKYGWIIIIVIFLTIALFLTRCQCNEKFCSIAPRFDYYYRSTKGFPQGPSAFPTGYSPSEVSNNFFENQKVQGRDYEGRIMNENQPIVSSNRENFSYNDKDMFIPPRGPEFSLGPSSTKGLSSLGFCKNNSCMPPSIDKQGIIKNEDTIGSPYEEGCRSCGGDFPSAAPKRDFYFQPEQGMIGDGINSGYPFYKAL